MSQPAWVDGLPEDISPSPTNDDFFIRRRCPINGAAHHDVAIEAASS